MAAKKTIENKPTELTRLTREGSESLKYFDVIKTCLDQSPAGGFSRDEIKKRNRIEEKLVGEIAELEHDEFYNMKKICNEYKWLSRHVDIEKFLNYLDDVK